MERLDGKNADAIETIKLKKKYGSYTKWLAPSFKTVDLMAGLESSYYF
jgi:hypothetical protein